MAPHAVPASSRQQGREDPEEKRESSIHKVVRGHLHKHDEDDHDEQRLGYGSAFYVTIVPEITCPESQAERQAGVEEKERQPASQQERYVYGLGVGED